MSGNRFLTVDVGLPRLEDPIPPRGDGDNYWNAYSSYPRGCVVQLGPRPGYYAAASRGDAKQELEQIKRLLRRATLRVPSLGWGCPLTLQETSDTVSLVVPARINKLGVEEEEVIAEFASTGL